MLNLKLRDEFLGSQMPGTAISLRTSDNQGAAQKSPENILSITYPTADVQTALKAISTKRNGCPIVLMGDRGRGKSHIMAVMHHAIQSPDIIEKWLKNWGAKLGSDELNAFEIVTGYVPISEPVHNHEYPLLWDFLFERHPRGEYYRGQFESKKQPFPPRTLLEKMFEEKPTCLILDEFQKWFDGLHNQPGDDGIKYKTWAENFIQNLSEISKDRPEILIFAISVLDNKTDAYQQVHRQGPVIIDFRGPSAKQDRQKLLLHRLFENRRNIQPNDISSIAGAYANERFRLLHSNKSEAEKERIQQEVFACWPFSPELLERLEDHILLSSAAQNTRDLIRIMAQVFRSRGDLVPVITPSDFFVDGESQQVQTLVDAIAVQAGQERLREIAQRNLGAVHASGVSVPNARELVSTIWMRSITPGRTAGGTPAELHLDITRNKAIDDNAFQAELALLIENSVNIHGDQVPGGPLWFGLDENPRSKVRACAKNNNLWHIGAVSSTGQIVYPGSDVLHIQKTLRHIFVPETTQPPSRVIILGPNWKSDPWSEVDDADKPARWDRPVLLVIPDQIGGSQADINSCLGSWLAKHIQKRRNTIRFLLPASDMKALFTDEEIIYSARCSFLCSPEGWGYSDITYRGLFQDFNRPLRQSLKSRFNRFAILRKWDFQQPQNCAFDVEKISEQGGDIPAAVETKIFSDLFDRTEFKKYILKQATDSEFVGSLLDDLAEPPPPGMGEAIPFVGETRIAELLLYSAAEGEIVLNIGGSWIGRRPEDLTFEDARRFVQRTFRTGQELRLIQLGLPGMVGGGTITAPAVSTGSSTLVTGGVSPFSPSTQSGGIGPGTVPTTGGQTNNGTGVAGNGTPPINSPQIKKIKSNEPTTGINLSGCFENWGVSSAQTLETARIEFSGLTAQQIKQILQRIPSAFRATLEIEYEEETEQ